MLAIAMNKSKDKVALYVRIPRKQRAWLRKRSNTADLPVSKIVIRLIDKAMEADKEVTRHRRPVAGASKARGSR